MKVKFMKSYEKNKLSDIKIIYYFVVGHLFVHYIFLAV
jgi:hypothetical protein